MLYFAGPPFYPGSCMAPRYSTLDVSPDAERADDACLNCGARRLGDYCHVCGQHHLEGRLTVRLLWSEFAQRFFKLERGFGRTFVGLSRSPGGLARSYVAGHRRPLVNPLSYFLLGTAASLLLFQEAEFREVMEAGVKAFTFLTPEQSARFIELVLQSVRVSYAYQMAFLAVAMAAAWRLLFRKASFTFVENTIPALYIIGHASLFGAALTLGEIAGLYTLPLAISALLLPAAFVWVAVGFFPGRRVWTGLKTLFAFALAFVVYGVLRDGFLIALVLLGV